jgi:uncharacterized coiled-coil protein SlyX
LLEIE